MNPNSPSEPYNEVENQASVGSGPMPETVRPARTPSESELPALSDALNSPATVAPVIHLVEKHPLAIRWMHWINFPLLFIMIWSGLLIYWGDSDIANRHPHAVYRIGIGSWTLFRFFPAWFWTLLNAPFQITKGLGYHFFFMWLFGINGLIYVLYTAISGQWRMLIPGRHALREAFVVVLHDLHLHRGPLPNRKYNAAQQIAYTGVLLMGAASLVTGLAIYKPSQAHLVTTLLGGYEAARLEHFWLTIGFCAFFVVHVVQVALAGWNNFRSMVAGFEIAPREQPAASNPLSPGEGGAR